MDHSQASGDTEDRLPPPPFTIAPTLVCVHFILLHGEHLAESTVRKGQEIKSRRYRHVHVPDLVLLGIPWPGLARSDGTSAIQTTIFLA